MSHSESADSLFIIPTSVTPCSIVITLPLMGKEKIMYIPREGCTHMNLEATFKEQSTQNLPNSRSNRAYSASKPHPICNKAKKEEGHTCH